MLAHGFHLVCEDAGLCASALVGRGWVWLVRMVALGVAWLSVGADGVVVLADPGGNEFHPRRS